MAARSRAPRGEIFISHSSRDTAFVERIVRVLLAHGLRPWYSKARIVGARQWHDEIGKALARCRWIAVVLSPASVRSRWVKQELLYALNDARYDEHIVPILHRRCSFHKLSWTLPNFQMIDFTGDYATACRQLLKVWGLA